MRIILENNLEFQHMSNEDSSYPGENCIDQQPARIAQSSTSISQIIFRGDLISDFAMFNVNAGSGGLEILDHNDSNALVLVGKTDISMNRIDDNYGYISSTSTDLSDFANEDILLTYGWERDGNNSKVSIVGTPTATNISIAATGLATSIAGRSITLARWNSEDLIVDEDIEFAYVADWAAYFLGESIYLDTYYKPIERILIESTVLVSIYSRDDNPSVGLCYAGKSRSYGNTQYGYSKDIRDNSIYRDSINGSLNQIARPVNFDGSVPVSASVSESIAFEQIFKNFNSNYMVFILRDEVDSLSQNDVIYGKLKEKPRLIWDLPDRKNYSMKITQIGGYE